MREFRALAIEWDYQPVRARPGPRTASPRCDVVLTIHWRGGQHSEFASHKQANMAAQLSDAAICSSDQRPDKLRITANASSVAMFAAVADVRAW